MTPQALVTGGLAILAVGGVAEQSISITGAAAGGMAVMQIWTLYQLQPIKDAISSLRTDIAVLRQRLDDAASETPRNSRRGGKHD